MQRIKILEWDKVSLVVPEKQDIEIWYKGINNIETQSYLGSMYWDIIFKEDEEDYYELVRKNKNNRLFCIYINNEKKVIWNINLFDIDLLNRKAELWIVIFDIENRNKWYWSESINLILKFWFKALWLNKIKLRFVDFNERAQKVYEKIWFKKCWELKEEVFRNWEFHNDIYMEIFSKDFLNK